MSKDLNRRWLDLEHTYLAQGWTGTNSKRASQYVDGVYPTHLVKGDGPYVWDVDGNRYVDFVCALGPIILGYHNRVVDEMVIKQVKEGPIFSLPHPLEELVAEKLNEMIPRCEQFRFFKNGDDATTAAVRIARAATDIPRVVSEGYHGRSDIWTSMTPPALGVMEFFDIERPSDLKDPDGEWQKIFITEPIILDDSSERKTWLQQMMNFQKFTIFDEIVTGFRVPKYTVTNMWELKPDIVCLGKAMSNGYPLSCVGGPKSVMSCGEYFLSSTFSGDTIALGACLGTLKELQQRSMEDLSYYGRRFILRFNEIVGDLGIKLDGYGTRGMLNVTHPNTALLMQEACRSGILFGKAFFYNFAHLENEVEEWVLNVVSDIAGRIRRGEVKLEGIAPQETFKR